MKKNIIVTLLLVALAFELGQRVYAQSGQVIFLGAISGTTAAANCGTPTTPSLCVVGDGVWIWQSGASSWVKITTGAAAGVLKVQGTLPGATGNVQLTCIFPATMGSFTAGTNTSVQFGTIN